MTQRIDGKTFAANLRLTLKEEVSQLPSKPGLAVVIVGDDPASHVYVSAKEKACTEIGITSFPHKLPFDTNEQALLILIERLNNQKDVHGILVQLPLPKHINEAKILNAINPKKDVDGFHPVNQGLLLSGSPNLIPCTPLGCLMLIKSITEIAGKNALVIGRSNIVGKPMAALLLNESATVTIAHSKTNDLPSLVKQADIVVAAVGRPEMVKGEWLKQGAIVIDVGINRIERDGKNKLVGDVDTTSCEGIAEHITPVPGGVGPMTIACLMNNTVTAYKGSK